MSAVKTPVPVAEYQVRFTGLDTLGDERLATVDRLDLDGALEVCEHIQVNQENFQLPVDAAVWWRSGPGDAWKPWTGAAL